MSLNKLFTDRKARKYIRESINLDSLNEDTKENIRELADDYDISFESSEPTIESLLDIIKEEKINESMVLVKDYTKLEADAEAKFNGSIADLISSYGISKNKDLDTLWKNHKLWIAPNNMTSGKSKLNRFMDEYSAEFTRPKKIDKIAPDSDGYTSTNVEKQGIGFLGQTGTTTNNIVASKKTVSARVKVSDKKAPSKPVMKKPSISATSDKVSVGKIKYDIEGTDNVFHIKFGKSAIICTRTGSTDTTQTYDINLDKENKTTSLTVDAKNRDEAISEIISSIVKNPGLVLPSFDDNEGVYELNAYNDLYKFAVDEYTFAEKTVTLALVYNGKVLHSKNGRVLISDKALHSRSVLNSELLDYVENQIKSKYPALFVTDGVVKTSIGDAHFVFKGFDSNNKPVVHIEIANAGGDIQNVDEKDLGSTDKNSVVEDLRSLLYTTLIDKIIPDWNLYQNKVNEFELEVSKGSAGNGFTVYAKFDSNKYLETGDFDFSLSVVDKSSGEEYPDKPREVIYRKAGTTIKDFLTKEGSSIYKEFTANSNMTDIMKQSAREKLKNASRKEALFLKIGDIFKRKHRDIKELKDLDVSIKIEVNNKGYCTDAVIVVSDIYGDFGDAGEDLLNGLKLDSRIKYLSKGVVNIRENDPTVEYKVKDIDKFNKDVELYLIEGLICDVFNLIYVTESMGRKVFHI